MYDFFTFPWTPKSTSNGCVWHNEHMQTKYGWFGKQREQSCHSVSCKVSCRARLREAQHRRRDQEQPCDINHAQVFPLSAVGAPMPLIPTSLTAKATASLGMGMALHWHCFLTEPSSRCCCIPYTSIKGAHRTRLFLALVLVPWSFQKLPN